MGMYDYVRCEAPLPDGRVVDGSVFQTKDFDCYMNVVTITRDGRLMLQDVHSEVVPPAERPYPNAAEGSLESFFGCLRVVVDREYDSHFHGEMNFYGDAGDFIARFTDGQLQWIRPVGADAETPTGSPTQETTDGE